MRAAGPKLPYGHKPQTGGIRLQAGCEENDGRSGRGEGRPLPTTATGSPAVTRAPEAAMVVVDVPASGQGASHPSFAQRAEAEGAAAIRVVIVDDYPVERAGLLAMFRTDPELVVVGDTGSGAEAKRLVAELEPDVLILSLGMRNEDSLRLARALRKRHPSVRVVVLSSYEEESLIVDAIAAGASGYLLKDFSSSLLCHTVHAVAGGAVSFAEQVMREAMRRVTQADRETALHVAELTDRQREVLRLIALGKSNRDIAASLFLSESTVKKYVHTILDKLNASNRTDAAIKAAESGSLFAR